MNLKSKKQTNQYQTFFEQDQKITHNVRQYGWRRLRETTLMTAAAAAGNNRQSYAMTRR